MTEEEIQKPEGAKKPASVFCFVMLGDVVKSRKTNNLSLRAKRGNLATFLKFHGIASSFHSWQ
jgi:hypothetical protein